jgi:hypothetical protein
MATNMIFELNWHYVLLPLRQTETRTEAHEGENDFAPEHVGLNAFLHGKQPSFL